MASLLNKIRASIDADRRQLHRTVEAYRDPEIRSTLAVLNRVTKEGKSVSIFYGDPTVTFDLCDLDSFKRGPMPKLLDKLLNLGVEFRRSDDYAEGGSRCFYGKLGRVDVRVIGYLSDTAKQCQKVKIGEEVRVVPKYELCC